MKILEICMSRGFGGLELYVLKVAKYLNEHNFNCQVIARKNSFMLDKLQHTGINNKIFPSVFYLFPIISSLKLARYISANKIDVLHIHWGKDLFFVVLAKVFSRRKVRLVYTRHMALTRKKDDFYHTFLYRHVDVYQVITQDLYNDAVKYLPLDKNKIRLIYHGVSVPNNNIDCSSYLKEAGLSEEVFRLVIFGRIEKGKGQHLVIAAVNELKKQGHNVQLAMIGYVMDQEYFSTLEKDIKSNNLGDSVFYLGFHDTPTDIMPCFDVVILATKCETFGLVLPEAMRAGVVVVGSNCGGVPEIINHEKTGLLFESENINDLTEQLSKLESNPTLCKELAKAGKEDADIRFSEEAHFKELIKLFNFK